MKCIGVVTLVLLISVAGTAMADWNLRDPHKMHYPQLPDPDGWDVNATNPNVLADDWRCSESGPVSDVHLWGSWRHDDVGQIRNIHLSIHDNIPETPNSHSRPGELLWERDFGPDQFAIRDIGTGEQGWYDPSMNEWFRPDHHLFHQINIMDIKDPFIQKVGTVYWLDVSVDVESDAGTATEQWGWKTSGSPQFMDDAVWGDFASGATQWNELTDPLATTKQSLDLAFVITPEPTSMALLGLGGLTVLRRRRRR